jgi:flagellar basal-body rod protein FlgC
MQINASGLALERLKMDTISTNIANVNTTRTEEGGPYLRKDVVFEEKLRTEISKVTGRMEKKSAGVRVVGIAQDEENLEMVYNPSHPDANEEGYVSLPNIDPVREMVDMISATRAYEANVAAINATKTMAMRALDIGRV